MDRGARNILRIVTAMFFIAWLPFSVVSSQEIRVSAPDEVLEGETFQIQYEVLSYNPLREMPELGDTKNFEIVGEPMVRSASPSLFWGQDYYTFRFLYNLKARKSGDLKLPRLEIVVKGKKILSEDAKISVVKLPEREDVDCFVEVETSSGSVKIGSTLTMTYKLYTTKELTSAPRILLPRFGGFNIEDATPRTLGAVMEKKGGKEYYVYIIRKLVLQPMQLGEREIPGGTVELNYNYPTGRVTRDSWGRAYEEQIQDIKTCNVEATTIRVHNMSAI